MRASKSLRLAGMALMTAALGFGTTACKSGSGADMTGMQLSKPSENIIQVATGDNMEEVTTLVKLVKAADLVNTLEGPGPFTVFAPTNAAFAKLPQSTLDDLMKPENKEKLKDILQYHVVSGKAIMAADASTMSQTMADGKAVSVSVMDGKVTLSSPTSSAMVIKPDIKCSNGVIHWVDGVLLPPAN